MKIEFKKLPSTSKDFSLQVASVKFSGNFAKISQSLANMKANILGDIDVVCCGCGCNFAKQIDETNLFLLSNGIYTQDNEKDKDKIIIEIDNEIVDFHQICQSEIESFKSDYYRCDNCSKI